MLRFKSHAGAASTLRSDLEKGLPPQPRFHPLVEGCNQHSLTIRAKHVRRRYSWLREANRGLSSRSSLVSTCLTDACLKASFLETGRGAVYSLLRRKKNHAHTYGEARSVNPRRGGIGVDCEASFGLLYKPLLPSLKAQSTA